MTASKQNYRYIEIADLIRKQIQRGELGVGDRLPSYAKMYRDYGVTPATMQRVFAVLEQELLIERRSGSGIYIAEPKRVRTGNIGLLTRGSRPQELYAEDFIAGIQAEAQHHGESILLIDDEERIDATKIDGLVLNADYLEALILKIPADMPRVLILTPGNDPTLPNVIADNFSGARQATEYLLSQGHRRISYLLSSNYDPFSIRRLAGYRSALEAAGVPFDENLVRYLRRERNTSLYKDYFLLGEEGMTNWLAEGWRDLESSAILTPNDVAAIGMMRAFSSAGIEVPREVSIMGFDGLGIGRYSSPPLSTVQVPLSEIGAQAVRLLRAQMEGEHIESSQIVLPVGLTLRGSVAARGVHRSQPLRERRKRSMANRAAS